MSVEERGTKFTPSYRVYFKNAKGEIISPFHDIPTWANKEQGIANMVVEVPRWSNAKMEVSKGLPLNPIVQDEKKGKPRFVANCFPHKGYIWNYGAIPQTWENPAVVDKHTNAKGDKDPIDVCDISDMPSKTGDVVQVKVLGVMAMIDEGETDWKIIAIDVRDPRAAQLNDVDDIDKIMPGILLATYEWFRIYKIPDGKPENVFAFNGEAKNKEFAMGVLNEQVEQWHKLMDGEAQNPGIALSNLTVDGKSKITQEEAASIVAKDAPHSADAPLDPSVHQWHYIKL